MTISCSEKFERQINLKLKFFDTAMDDYQSAVREYYEDNTRPVPCDFCNRFCKAKTDGEGLVLIKPNNKEDLKEYYKCNRDYVKSVMLNEKRLESIRKLKIFISTCKPVFPSGSSVGGALPNYLPANIRSNLVWQETIKTVTDVIIKQEVTREYYLEEIPLPNFYGQSNARYPDWVSQVGVSCSDITDLSVISIPKNSFKREIKKYTTPVKTETYKFNIEVYTAFNNNNVLEWYYDSDNIGANVDMTIDDTAYNKQLNLFNLNAGVTVVDRIEINRKDATILCVDDCGRKSIIITPGWKLMVKRTRKILDIQKNDRLIDSCKEDNAKFI